MINRPTVCVSGFWAGVDSAWEQRKLEAWKMPENAAESHTSGAPPHDGIHHVSRKKQGRLSRQARQPMGVYCNVADAKAVQSNGERLV